MTTTVTNELIYEILKDVRDNQYHTHRKISFIEDELKSHRRPSARDAGKRQ